MSDDTSLNDAWRLFERRVSDPIVIAWQFIETARLKTADLDFCTSEILLLDNNALLQAYRFALISSMSSQITDKEAIQLLMQLIKKEQELRGSALHETSPSQEKLGMYQEIMDEYIAAGKSFEQKDFDAARKLLEQGLKKWADAILIAPLDYLKQDLLNYRVDVLVLLGDLERNAGKILESEQVYEKAMQYALTTSDVRSIAYARNRLSASYRKSAQFDKALQILLPLRMENVGNNIDSIEVQLNLAVLFQQVPDPFDAKDALQETKRQLTKIGFKSPCDTNHDEVIAEWILKAHRLTWPADSFEALFFKIATMYMQIQSLHEMLAENEAEKNLYRMCIRHVTDVIAEARNRINIVILRDQQVLNQIGDGAMTDAYALPAQADRITHLKQVADELISKSTTDAFDETDIAKARTFLADLDINTEWGFYYAVSLVLGDGLLGTNRETEAIHAWNAALLITNKRGQTEHAIHFLGRLLSTPSVLSEHRTVLKYAKEATELIESYRYQISPAYLQSSFLTDKIRFYSLAVFAAWKMKDHETMLRIADLTKGWASLRSYTKGSSDSIGSETDLQYELQLITNQISSNTDAAMIDDLRIRRRILWDRIALQKASNTRQPDVLDLSALQKSLTTEQAILHYYWIADKVLLITCITKHDVITSRQILDDAVYQVIRDFPASMRATAGVRSAESIIRGIVLPGNRPTTQSLSTITQYLIPADVQASLSNKTRLWISPHRMLHSIPFHGLKVDGNFLIEKLAISYIPNLGVFARHTKSSTSKRLLLVGSSHYNIPQISLPELPGVTIEIENVTALYAQSNVDVKILKGTSASLENVRALANSGELSGHSVLHFAVHGNDIPADVPMEDNIFLSDGSIDGLEISTWNLNADLVILSACNSGERAVAGRGMASFPGDEIFGLQASFFAAGARAILGTLWPVDDNAATQIMTMFHQHFLDVADPAVALQLSVKQYLASASEREREMFYWAPFFVVEKMTRE